MQTFLMTFYILFFATGFMGTTALVFFNMRVRTRTVRPLLAIQTLFFVAMGMIVIVLYLFGRPGEAARLATMVLIPIILLIGAAVWVMVLVVVRRLNPRTQRRNHLATVAEILTVVVAAANVADIGATLATLPPAVADAWELAIHLITAITMVTVGVVFRRVSGTNEPPAVRSLLKAYGLVAIVFGPTGLIEYALSAAEIPWIASLSLDNLFYLAWNVASMSAAVRLFRPTASGRPVLDSVPDERVRALGLSGREVEMAILIGRGLTNKEIAEELHISSATVRTHIYNLYQKVGAGSRVELLNMLQD